MNKLLIMQRKIYFIKNEFQYIERLRKWESYLMYKKNFLKSQ